MSVNVLDEETYAYVRDTKVHTDGRLTVAGTNDTEIWSLAGSVAISLKGEKSSLGLADSISANVIHNDTQAFIADSTVDAESLSLLAKRTGTTRSLTASGSGAFVKEGIAVARSFSANVVLDTVEAYILDSTATLVGSSSINAENGCEILAIGGAAAYGGKYGFGVGIAVNVLGSELDINMTRAYVENSTVTIASGTLDVTALNDNPGDDPRILAVTGSLGLSFGQQSFTGAGTLSVNIIANDTQAYIKNSTVKEPAGDPGQLDAVLTARDESGIRAISGAGRFAADVARRSHQLQRDR